ALSLLLRARSPVAHPYLRAMELSVSPRATLCTLGRFGDGAAARGAGVPVSLTTASAASLRISAWASSARGPSTQWRSYSVAMRLLALSDRPAGSAVSAM